MYAPLGCNVLDGALGMVEQVGWNRQERPLSLYVVLAAIFGISVVLVSVVLVWNYSPIRTSIKWSVWSRSYKSEVLAQAASASGDLKHVEWDGWGWAGQDTTIYLVFDPTDSLSLAASSHKSGKFSGLPCEVSLVRQLESHWYAVQFYTNEYWGKRNVLNCSGSQTT